MKKTKQMHTTQSETRPQKFTSRQKLFLLLMSLCIIGCIYTVIKVQHARLKMQNSAAVTAQITKASDATITAQKRTSRTKHGTSSTCKVKVYQDLTFTYSYKGKSHKCNMPKVTIFSHSYSCNDENTAIAYARADMQKEKYIYQEGDSLAIYVEKKNENQIYLADELEKQTSPALLFFLIPLGIYFLILSFVPFKNASGASDAGVMFGLTGVLILSVEIMDLFYNGVRFSKPGIVANAISLIAILVGILLIRWDLKEDSTRKK